MKKKVPTGESHPPSVGSDRRAREKVNGVSPFKIHWGWRRGGGLKRFYWKVTKAKFIMLSELPGEKGFG